MFYLKNFFNRLGRFGAVRRLALCVLLPLFAPVVSAQLSIEITQGNDQATSIAIVPLRLEVESDRRALGSINEIITNDLVRSGHFRVLPAEDMLSYPSNLSEVYYRDWRVLGVQYLMFGHVSSTAQGIFSVHFYLLDIEQEKVLVMEEADGFLSDVRALAHAISNTVHEQVTGLPGAFSTQLAYVSVDKVKRKVRYSIKLTDVDGNGTRVLHESAEPLLSPAWSPNGREMAYVSFEYGYSTVMLHNLVTEQVRRLIEDDGDVRSSAPAFSPDASKLAVTLVRRDNTDIYIYDLASGELERVTTHYRIDTEPSWTPDGKSLVFTSGRSGGPQIFKIELASGEISRLTFEGNYNAHAQVLPDGNRVAFIHRAENIFHIAMTKIDKPSMRLLAKTAFNESPSISPNGVMLIYATDINGRGTLVVTSLAGHVRYHLPDAYGNEVREPVWSPFFTEVLDVEASGG